MKIIPKFQDDNEMVHAVLRMNSHEYETLHKFMHAEAGDAIRFPYGAYISMRGRGWYRLVSGNSNRAIDKVQFALRVIKRFLKEEEAKTTEEIKRIMPIVIDNSLRVNSFSNAGGKASWSYTSDRMPTADNRPASPNALAALAAKFPQHSNGRHK